MDSSNGIKKCRVCRNDSLVPVVDLGKLALTGTFPKYGEPVDYAPLELVLCYGGGESESGREHCGLLQLKHSFPPGKMYGDNYGYRSGLSQAMVNHLRWVVDRIVDTVILEKGDLIVDIGSNDGTLLAAYDVNEYKLVGIDPTGSKFRKYYLPHIDLIPEFFSKEIIQKSYGNMKAKVISSIAMFYDLEDPLGFAQQIYDLLDDNGIWVLEQSYMPTMLANNAYDTICHEHLEYYGLYQIKWIAERAGLEIIGVEFNDTNGGSFLTVLAKKGAKLKRPKAEFIVDQIINWEVKKKELLTLIPYNRFQRKISRHREDLRKFILGVWSKGEVVGYGASTKGNVLLQVCGLSDEHLTCIVEINEDKFGRVTPGTNIPIVDYSDMRRRIKASFFHYLVLPWHFKTSILKKEEKDLKRGIRFIFPLPVIDEIGEYRDMERT